MTYFHIISPYLLSVHTHFVPFISILVLEQLLKSALISLKLSYRIPLGPNYLFHIVSPYLLSVHTHFVPFISILVLEPLLKLSLISLKLSYRVPLGPNNLFPYH
jgi:hypothetical protein